MPCFSRPRILCGTLLADLKSLNRVRGFALVRKTSTANKVAHATNFQAEIMNSNAANAANVADTKLPEHVPVLIAGGGPVGLTLAALLGRHGVRCLVIEADASYCSGSRAICLSRRSQEIFGWLGGDRALVAKGLPWTGGRSYFRDAEVLHFQMPSDPRERFAPMINIQQFYVEEIAHKATQAVGDSVDVRWSSQVVGVQQHDERVDVTVAGADGAQGVVRADWLV